MTSEGPGPEVLAAFGATGSVERLPGGQGTSWRCGKLVLKPRDMPAEALAWLAEEVGPRLRGDALRVALPVPSTGGWFEVAGWTAFPYLPGDRSSGRWLDIVAAGRRFSELCAGIGEPAFIRGRTDAWARADRSAWGEETLPEVDALPEIRRIRLAMRPVNDPPTLVHGDLTGNVLFDTDLPPAIIDLSLYWRPIEYASAIVAVDAITVDGAPPSLLGDIALQPGFGQCLLRAILFRMVTDHLLGRPADEASSYRRVIEATFAFLATRS
jgi:uncharacterized protein (TIGR02569 family)